MVACPLRYRSTTSQASIPAAAAKCVLTSAWTARSLPASAEPALNPNQPNQRMPVPISVRGKECGGIGCCGPAPAPPEDEHRGERGDPGVDVHDGAAREVERAAL